MNFYLGELGTTLSKSKDEYSNTSFRPITKICSDCMKLKVCGVNDITAKTQSNGGRSSPAVN